MQRFLPLGRALALAATLVAAPFAAPAAQAQSTQYSFTRIADTAGPLSGFNPRVALNNAGTIAFQATLDAGGQAIFTSTGAGGQLTTIAASIAATSPNSPYRDLFGSPSINNNGTVAFAAQLTSGGRGLLTSSGGQVTTITTTASGQVAGITGPDINDRGQIAFSGGDVVYVADGGGRSITTIATSQSVGFFPLGSQPSLNNAGTVAFTGAPGEAPPVALFTGNGGQLTRITEGGPFSRVGTPDFNNPGALAFSAFRTSGGQGVFVLRNGQTSVIADTAGAFATFADVAINDAGRVVFRGSVRGGGSTGAGIFTGSDPVADRVIRVGDALDGSTVSLLVDSRPGFNDRGQIAFLAQLADGRVGIYRADPGGAAEVIPEPGTLALLAAGAGLSGLMALRRRC